MKFHLQSYSWINLEEVIETLWDVKMFWPSMDDACLLVGWGFKDFKRLEPWEKLFPYNFTDNALGMHGVPNVGKTPLGRIIAMAMSRYWARKLNSKANLALGRLQSLISFGAKPVEKIGQICSMWWLPSRTANAETQRLLRCELPNSRKAKWESTWSMISTFQQSLSMKQAWGLYHTKSSCKCLSLPGWKAPLCSKGHAS